MNRQSIIRVLLSLVLLMSQQMAFTHAMAHWANVSNETAGLQSDRGGKTPQGAAHDKLCAQCLDFAQLASPVGTASRVFFVSESGFLYSAPAATSADRSCTVRFFQSRAPPQA